MSQQIPLALRLQHAPGLDDYVVGANQVVIDALRRSIDGVGEAVIFLSGAAGCGRTHLLLGQCAGAEQRGLHCAYVPLATHEDMAPEMLDGLETLDLIAIDDVHTIAGIADWEHALFKLFNRCRDRGTRLLFSADRGPAALLLTLPDLRSRLAWGLTLAVQTLDDNGRLALLKSLAERCALRLPEEVARYLLERSPRHPTALAGAIERLDRASLAEQRPLTIPFVRDQLDL